MSPYVKWKWDAIRKLWHTRHEPDNRAAIRDAVRAIRWYRKL